MRRLWPESLPGQVLLAVALALLAAQAINAILLLRAQDQRRAEIAANTIALRIVGNDLPFADERPRRGRGRAAFPLEQALDPVPVERRSSLESRIADSLGEQGIPVTDVRAGLLPLADDPRARAAIAERPRRWQRRGVPDEILVASIRETGTAGWTIVRLPVRERDERGIGLLIGQTVLIYLVLVGGLWWLLKRITRPLASLTTRVERFAAHPEPGEPLPEEGPHDTRRLIAAHNAMEARIAALLNEKDVMLGAIGHDLKTPLAALRVRIESVADDAARAKMAAGIEDIARSLDDILSLARVGRDPAAAERVQLTALAAAVVEEFEDLGKAVTLADGPAIVAPIRTTWVRRALRNLIENAVRYGGSARISLQSDDGFAILRVDDDGPGIPEAEIAAMLEPFRRGESSRNRATGGAGLGLTLARAIAEQHGGRLVLANRSGRGLRAELRLPLA